MNIPFTLIFVAAIVTIISISILRPFAISINLTDSPNDRKNHQGDVPLIGGLSMFFGFFISILSSSVDLNDIKYFILASLIVVIVGLLDDHRDMSIKFRFLFQATAAIIVSTVAGVNIESLGDLISLNEIYLNSWSVFFTIIAIICSMNAVNMSDGINGLAGSSCFITLASIAFLAYLNSNLLSLTISLLMCSVILPFLVENLCIGRPTKKRIFMGDAGSMFLGLGIAWLLINLSQGDSRAFSPVIALWLFAIPLIDIVSIIFRRLIIRKSLFKPDLNHSHHILIKAGFSSNLVLIIMISMSLIMALIGVFGVLKDISEPKMFFGFIIIFLLYFTFSHYLVKKINRSTA